MKKLIQLLNLYQEERKSKFKFSSYDHNSSAFIIEKSPKMVLGEETIISKKFGFIQWLIEKRKVEWFLIPEIIKAVKVDSSGLHDYNEYYEDWEILLMHLSIQDDPINFLISILK